MADITLTVDTTSISDAKKKLDDFGKAVNKFSVLGLSRGINSLQGNIRELVNAQRQGTIGGSAYQLGLLEIKRAYEQMGYSSQAATAAVRRYAAELQRQEAARAAEQAARELAKAQQEAAATAQRLADRQRELRMRFQEGYSTFVKQRQAMRDLREAYRANIITLDQYNAKLAQIRAGGGNLTQHINQQATGLNRFGVITQQAGYQVGDFFVQVQSGTNVLVAFGQQATQLIGTFAALATSVKAIAVFSVLGVLVSIGTAIGAYFMRASGSSDTLSQKFDKLKTSTDKVNETFERLQDKDLALKFGNMTTSVTSLSTAMLELDKSAQLKNLLGTLGKLEEQANAGFFRQFGEGFLNIGRFVDPFSDVKGPQQVNEEAFNKLGFQMARSQFLSYTEELKKLASSGDTEGVLKVFDEFIADATDAGTAVGKISTEGYAVADGMRSALLAIAESAALLNGSAKDAERLVEAEKQKLVFANAYYQNLLAQDALNKSRDEAVTQLKQAYADELTQLKQQKDLLQTIKDFGEGSVEAKAKEAQLARETYQAELQRQGLVGNFLTILMQQYDEVVALKGEMDGMSDLQREINQYAVEFAQTDLASGVDAAAAAALALADRLGISVDRAKEMMALGYGAPVVFDPRDPDFDPAKASAARAAQLQKDRFGFSYGTMVTGTKFADDKKGGGGSEKDVIADFQKQLELERELLGTSEAYQKVRQALGDDFRKTSPEVIAGLVQQATEIERLIELEEQRKSIMDTVKSSLEDGFMSMVDGTKSVKDAFKSMAAEIIKELYRVYVVQQIVGGISGGVGSLFGGGNFLTGPSTGSFGLPFGRAAGGPVIANQPYMVGERGPELIIPRSSGTVLNSDKTKAAIGGSNDVTVNNNISVTGSDAAMVRAEVAKMIPQITNATKAAVIDARLRGGQMKQAFR
jgi:hypothetical protein